MDGGPGRGVDEPAILRLSGDVDAFTQDEYRRQADRLLASAAPRPLVVHMGGVTTIDSSGLGLLVHLQSRSRERGVPMVLTDVPPRARALLKRTGLDRVFRIDDGRSTA